MKMILSPSPSLLSAQQPQCSAKGDDIISAVVLPSLPFKLQTIEKARNLQKIEYIKIKFQGLYSF